MNRIDHARWGFDSGGASIAIRALAAAVALCIGAPTASSQVTTYIGHQITSPTGTLTFTWPASSGSLANYTEAGLRVTCPGYGRGQGCTGGPRGGGCCVPYGFSHGGWYFAGGVQDLVHISRADGGALSGVEFQAGDGVNGCATTGNGTTYLWALVYSGGNLIGDFDINVPTGTYVGFTGTFDEVRLGGYAFASSRDEHSQTAVQIIGLDNMRYVASACPGFGAPTSIYTCVDGNYSFAVAAVGESPLSYRWQWQAAGTNDWTDVAEGFNSAPAPFTFTAVGSQSPTLSRTGALTPGSVVQYRCVVTSTCGSIVGAPATLAIRPAPIISEQPLDAAMCLPGVSFFQVQVPTTDSDPGPFSFQWQSSSNGITWHSLTNGESIIGATTQYLTWIQEDTDPHQFRCIVTNPCSSTTSAAAHLTFGNGPVVGVQPFDASTCPGGYAAFDAESAGNEAVAYQWQVESPPDTGLYLDIPNNDTFVDPATGLTFYAQGTDSPYVTFADFVLADHPSSVRFAAILSNACGSVSSNPATLTICTGDYNCDGGIDGADVEAFFTDWQDGSPIADVNGDGGVDGSDVGYFFERWERGC